MKCDSSKRFITEKYYELLVHIIKKLNKTVVKHMIKKMIAKMTVNKNLLYKTDADIFLIVLFKK